jgi:hypothetical protein
VYTRFAQEFTNPLNGPMNLATYLPNHFVPPDLGPKSYIAYGSKTENPPHDSVTRMHEDLCDAVNVLLYAARVETDQASADDDQCAPALASPSSASVNNEHDRTFADSLHASLDVPRDSLSGRPRQIASHIATLPICCTETSAIAIETRRECGRVRRGRCECRLPPPVARARAEVMDMVHVGCDDDQDDGRASWPVDRRCQ